MTQAKSWDAFAKFQTTDFKKCSEWWQDGWVHCTQCQGDYFEGDNIY